MNGMVFDIQKFSIHDGPGIRTTVFVKGCPLRCLWCHNPESQERAPQLSFNPRLCIGCGYCFAHCDRHGHRLNDGNHELDRSACIVCGCCAKGCHTGALEMIGREASVDEVIADVLRDRPFYETSGGGMTVSGGEPLLQIDFTEALLRRAKAEGLHCCIETCGHAAWERLERLLPLVDLWLYDVKSLDSERHLAYTGVPNDLILANLRELHQRQAAIILRLPTVPGLNDRPDDFAAIAALARSLPGLKGVEVMPYHRLGDGKAARLGTNVSPLEVEPPARETVNAWIRTLTALGVNVLNERH